MEEGYVRGQRLGCGLCPVSRTLLCGVSGCVRMCLCVCWGWLHKTKVRVRVIVVMYLCTNEHSSAVTLVIMSIHEVAVMPLC